MTDISRQSIDAYLDDVATAYDRAEHGLNTYGEGCYDILKRALWSQLGVLSAFVSVTFVDRDPYGSSAEMFEHIRRGALCVYRKAELSPDHPFAELAPNGETFNSVFRAVHDGLAHYPDRHSFSPYGELRAFQAHCRLLTSGGQHALLTETVGQNAYFRRYKRFAPQKTTLLPVALLHRGLNFYNLSGGQDR